MSFQDATQTKQQALDAKVNAWATRPPMCSSLQQHTQYILSNVTKLERNRATSSGNQAVLADTRYKNTLIFTEARFFSSRFYVFYVPTHAGM